MDVRHGFTTDDDFDNDVVIWLILIVLCFVFLNRRDGNFLFF